jgi:outer membrane protein OmpA-like peptidoglycan-associated protein
MSKGGHMPLTGKLIILAIILVGGYLGLTKTGVLDQFQKVKKAADIGSVVLPNAPEASLTGNAKLLPLPSAQEAPGTSTQVIWKVMAWNAQFALMYANGGPVTTKGSLMEKAGVTVNVTRQDDCNKACADLVKFAGDYKKDPSTPAAFITLMGDGMPAFNAGLCKELAPLGADYMPITFYPMGKSYGEDKFMGPAAWKNSPQAALGGVVAGVLRDGDVNIVLKWGGDNNLAINPDETTYDAKAINFISANDFLDAPNKYITGYKEKRKIVVNGVKTTRDTTVGVDAVATWTPGDVNAAKQKGGLVVIASTKQYAAQMPAVTITIRAWAAAHSTAMNNIIIALASAGDQVRSYSKAQVFAADVSAKVYNEKDGAYWLKYYNGVTEPDANGNMIPLGGSMAFNLADAANMFGLGNDHLDRYKQVYKTFGDIISKLYPEIVPTYPEYSTIVDKSYLLSVVANHPELLEGKALTVQYADKITEQVSSKSYQGKEAIQFKTGSSTIQSSSYSILDGILRSAVVAEGLKVGVYGHTDNTGNHESNMALSQERAQSVKAYLIGKGLPANEIEANGFGPDQPIASNATADGRAKNRRVQIVLGQ